jgi:hypothetical protein
MKRREKKFSQKKETIISISILLLCSSIIDKDEKTVKEK